MELALAVAVCVLLALVIILFVMVFAQKRRLLQMERKYSRFLRGKEVRSMEEIILSRFAEIDSLKKSTKMVAENLSAINEMTQMAIQKTGLVRYDAFDDIGGNLSFALALLTKNNDGVVLNCVHGKEGCYTYIKEVVKGEAYIALSEDEQKALERAKNLDNFMG